MASRSRSGVSCVHYPLSAEPPWPPRRRAASPRPRTRRPPSDARSGACRRRGGPPARLPCTPASRTPRSPRRHSRRLRIRRPSCTFPAIGYAVRAATPAGRGPVPGSSSFVFLRKHTGRGLTQRNGAEILLEAEKPTPSGAARHPPPPRPPLRAPVRPPEGLRSPSGPAGPFGGFRVRLRAL